MKRLTLWNWHTPYVSTLARALPDWQLYVISTAHAPTGWRDDRRPMPSNVSITADIDASDAVVIAQTASDLAGYQHRRCTPLPLLYLSHNHAAFEQPALLQEFPKARLICISEMKEETWKRAGYTQPITVIPPGIPLEDYAEPWIGDELCVLTVVNGIRRPLFDLDAWLAATAGWPVKLIGEGNKGIPGAVGPARSWDALRSAYQHARVYLNPTTPPYENTYNLASLEAAASGCPVRNLHGPHPDIANFPFDLFKKRWQKVLEEVTR